MKAAPTIQEVRALRDRIRKLEGNRLGKTESVMMTPDGAVPLGEWLERLERQVHRLEQAAPIAASDLADLRTRYDELNGHWGRLPQLETDITRVGDLLQAHLCAVEGGPTFGYVLRVDERLQEVEQALESLAQKHQGVEFTAPPEDVGDLKDSHGMLPDKLEVAPIYGLEEQPEPYFKHLEAKTDASVVAPPGTKVFVGDEEVPTWDAPKLTEEMIAYMDSRHPRPTAPRHDLEQAIYEYLLWRWGVEHQTRAYP